MIVQVTFTDDVVMMFGATYKSWTVQFDEYCWDYKNYCIHKGIIWI
ncbi:hypothetical protein [Bacillus sp. FJAT-28004]|nr:hypothetical protein [Bacillus sp. FJAT-28004]